MKRVAWTILILFAFATFTAQELHAQGAPRLVGWWKMDEAPDTTSLADSSGYGRNAIFGPGVTIVDGRIGKAARFDGSTDAWARFTPNFPAYLTNFTISAWVNVHSFSNTYPKIIQLGNFYYQFQTANPGKFSIGIGASPRADWISDGVAPFIVDTNQWVHAALVVKREYTNATDWVAQPTFFINGLRCGAPGTPKSYSPESVGVSYGFIGNTSIGGTRALDGTLDDVRIYDQDLSDREILSLFQNCPVGVDAGLGQTCYRATAALQGRMFSTNPYSRELAATTTWSVVSAPAGVPPVLDNASLPDTSVTLTEAGTYVFRLTAFSELGSVSNEVTVVRATGEAAGNTAPAVTALWSTTNTVLGTGAPLAATVTDDGNPGATHVRWSKVSGPGGVFFDNAFTNATTAYFSTNGTYVVQLEADDGAATDTDIITVTVTLPAGDLSNGLVHWWRMDESPDGNKSYDSIGTNTLSFVSQTMLQPGKSGYGLRFPNINAYAQTATVFTNADSLSFSLWLYHDVTLTTNNVGKRIFDYGTTRFFMYFNPDKIILATYGTDNKDYSWWQQGPNLTSNQWIHLTVLFDRRAATGVTQAFYINGTPVGSSTYGGTFPGAKDFTTGGIKIGGNGYGRNFAGVFDDLRVYNRLLTDEEVRLLATDPDNNHAPVIEAPSAVSTKVRQPLSSLATVYDDGQPSHQSLAAQWSVVSGNADKVQFENADAPDTAITITQSGEYVLRLTASDGELQSALNVSVSATPTGTVLMVR